MFCLNVAFHSSPSFIQIWWYSLCKSIFITRVKPYNSSSMLSKWGMQCWYFTMILLTPRQSTHILQVPPILGTKKIGIMHVLILFIICPLANNSLTCFPSSLVSSGLHWYASRLGIATLERKSIWCSIPLIGGDPVAFLREKHLHVPSKEKLQHFAKDCQGCLVKKKPPCIESTSLMSLF